MSKPKLSFSLKGAAPQAPPPRPNQAVRAFSADDDGEMQAPSSRAPPPVSRTVRKQQEEAARMDASTFDYDGVYDQMKQVEREMQHQKKEQDKDRKPKYMRSFFEAAELRERDRLRAESKMIQRERAAEGDQFGDKEAFVTSAYKAQQEEWKRAEEEERVREARERSKSRGVPNFRHKILEDEERRQKAAMDAIANAPRKPTTEPAPLSDKARAEHAQAQGLHVELNDDHQIVDQRDLLKRGLNVMKRKEREEPPPPSSSRAKRSQLMEDELLARLLGNDDA